MPIERRTLGKTGLDVSVIGWGCAPAAFLKTDVERAVNVANTLLDEGVNLLDTATGYPGSHDFIGEHLSGRRDDYVLVSKVGSGGAGTDEDFAPDKLAKQVDDALDALKTDYIDVMLLHSCTLAVLKAGDALDVLVRAREAGKIRFAGYSGDNEAATFACGLPDVAVLETSVNIADQVNIDHALPQATNNSVGVIAKRPIANAAWKDLSDQQGMYQKYAKTYTERLAEMKLDPSKFGLSWSELALRFTLSHPVTTAIIGTTNPDHAEANLKEAAKGPLDAEVIADVRRIFAAASHESNQKWTGQT